MLGAGPAKSLVVLAGLVLGCQRGRTEAPASEAEHSRRAPNETLARDGGERERSAVVAARSTEPAASVLRPSEPVGGRWVSCYANYRPTSTPERDLIRLTAACGPENGMVPVAPMISGDAVDAAEDHRLEAGAGECFRIFAVADAFVTDLGVEVINPRGSAVTWDRNGDRWPVLNPDGPFCLFDAGTYTVRVRALQGKGRYALQIWRLP